jgi:prepilin-type N-terminal cleavage/methylation domain-containing protein
VRLPRWSRLPLPRLGDEDGFGLIEMMIALTILAIATTALTGVFVAAHYALRRASQADSATVLADKVLERFRAEHWDDIGLNATAVTGVAGDPKYPNDQALNLPAPFNEDITNTNAPPPPAKPADSTDTGGVATTCADATTLPVTCNPSRAIPDSSQSPPEVAPDGRSYRIDTYVTWGCPVTQGSGAETLGGSLQAPTCSVGGTVVPYAPVKVVTVVVRDASSLATVYRTSTTFDRLGGGSMPEATATPSGSSSSSGGGSSSSSGAPDAPSSVALADGGGSGNAYIDLGNVASLSFDVGLPSSSVAGDNVTLTVTDGTYTITKSASATQGAGLVHFTGINGQPLADGTISVSVISSNSSGSSAVTVLAVTKDTVPPSLSGLSYTDKTNSTSDQIGGSGETNAAVTISETSPASKSFGPTTVSSGSFTLNVAAIAGSNQSPISYSYTVNETDLAGNTTVQTLSGQDKK